MAEVSTPQAVRRRLAAYRELLRRDGPVPELERLVAMLEDELREAAPAAGATHDAR